MRVLFVCSRNKLRSPTAEALFSGQANLEVMSAGTEADADHQVCSDLIEWADILFAMESIHRVKLNKMFGSLLRDKRIIVLDIPDNFKYMDDSLIAILRNRVPKYLR